MSGASGNKNNPATVSGAAGTAKAGNLAAKNQVKAQTDDIPKKPGKPKAGKEGVGRPPDKRQAGESAILDDKKAYDGNIKGVGGQLTQFRLAMVVRNDKGGVTDSKYNYVDFEMAPARRSFADKQGQMVPGAGAGMEMPLTMNLAKLNVPGSRPIHQPMGIGEERIELVGAFIGFDEYMGSDTLPQFDNKTANLDKERSKHSAWQKSQRLAHAVRSQKEMFLQLGWTSGGQSHQVQFENGISFRGFVKQLVRTYATPQRVYYRIVFVINNREDILRAPDSSSGNMFFLPESVHGFDRLPTTGEEGTVPGGNQTPAGVGDGSPSGDPELNSELNSYLSGAVVLSASQASTAKTVSDDPVFRNTADKVNADRYIGERTGRAIYSSSELETKKIVELVKTRGELADSHSSIVRMREFIYASPTATEEQKQTFKQLTVAAGADLATVDAAIKGKQRTQNPAKPQPVGKPSPPAAPGNNTPQPGPFGAMQ